MPDILIIGYGNPLRQDDGVGRRAVLDLQDTLAGKADCIAVHQLTQDLAETISRRRNVVFVDAAVKPQAGVITREKIRPATERSAGFVHTLNPTDLISLTSVLYGKDVDAVLYTLSGESFEIGEDWSASVSQAYPQFLREILDYTNTLYNELKTVQPV